MNRIAGVARLQLKDKWSWIFLPWVIVLSSFAVNLIVFASVGSEQENYTGGVASIFIYLFVVGVLAIPQTLSFALGLSVRRSEYYWGTAGLATFLSAVFAIVLAVFSIVERETDGWGVRLNFFRVSWLSDGSVAGWTWIMFVAFLNMFFSGFLLTAWKRKFGLYGLYALIVALSLIAGVAVVLCTYYERWDDLQRWLQPLSAVELFSWLAIPAAIYATLSYFLLRRTTA